MNMIKKNGGFTLVELIVVIAILAILAGIAVPAYSGYITKANEAADYTMLDAVKTAVIFAATEADTDHDCIIKGMTVTKDSTEVTVSGDDIQITDNKVDVKDYVSAVTFKTTNVTGATWHATDDADGSYKAGWTLTKTS